MSLIQKIKDEISSILSKTKGNTDKLEEQIHAAIDEVSEKHNAENTSDSQRPQVKQINSYAHETAAPKPKDANEAIEQATPVPAENDNTAKDEELPEGDVRNEDGSISHADGSKTNPDGSVVNADGTVTPAK